MSESTPVNPSQLGALLTFLSEARAREPGQFRGWTFRRVSGGANNLVYRVRESDETYAVKFCLADERDRAGREYAALSLLNDFSIPLAPKALLLEREHCALPVVVQAWLEGEVMRAPVSEAAWDTLLTYYAALHSVTWRPGAVVRALHTASSVAEGRALIRGQLEHLPNEAYPNGLKSLLKAFETWPSPSWPQPRLALCRVDPNPTNFVRTRDGLRSVDWENSGWGDPAFEIADLLAHPAYSPASSERAAEIAERYAERVADSCVALRVKAYYGVGLMYWVVRFARALYEVPRGLDARLVERPRTWQAETQRKYGAYLERARRHFAGLERLV